jgi:hypothetical protein
MKLNEHGKQKHMGPTLTPQELYSTLTKGKSKREEMGGEVQGSH